MQYSNETTDMKYYIWLFPAPTAPRNLKLTAESSTVIKASWTAPSKLNGVLNVTWWGMVYQRIVWIPRCIPQPQSTHWPYWISSLLTMFKSMPKRLFPGLPQEFFRQRQKKMVSAVIGFCCCCCSFWFWFSFVNVCRRQPHTASIK